MVFELKGKCLDELVGQLAVKVRRDIHCGPVTGESLDRNLGIGDHERGDSCGRFDANGHFHVWLFDKAIDELGLATAEAPTNGNGFLHESVGEGHDLFQTFLERLQSLHGSRLFGQRGFLIGKGHKRPVKEFLEFLKCLIFTGFGSKQVGDQFVSLIQFIEVVTRFGQIGLCLIVLLAQRIEGVRFLGMFFALFGQGRRCIVMFLQQFGPICLHVFLMQ